ncbi:hypothetical protein SAMN02745174_02033 [Cetobacterium ceti]|uniref:Uncharacterized protein n=1 Tax=Cetobacterium ceti TaxID=180163 RepID=A0A1T4PVD2_9FUSO|nr:hypothetical protein [Cetobacterium ceti]SJZ94878.1 hypothetical protein SAMN02745174_02033 [Cetobacterium ceti]
MYIYLDDNNSVFSYTKEKNDKGIFIDRNDFLDLNNIYIYENNELIEFKRPEGVKVIFDFDKRTFVDLASSNEKQNFYKTKMIEVNEKIKELNEIGLAGGLDYITLEKELDEYKKKYIIACQDEAIKIDEHMNSTKPGIAQVQ